MKYQSGDIVLVEGHGFVSSFIKRMTRRWFEPKTKYTHVEIIVVGGNSLSDVMVVSADATGVVLRDMHKHIGKDIMIVRPDLGFFQKWNAAEKAVSMVDSKYPKWRLLMYAFDWVLGLGLFDVYFFRRITQRSKVRVCSHLVAWAYAGLIAWPRKPAAMTPDDIADFLVDSNVIFSTKMQLGDR